MFANVPTALIYLTQHADAAVFVFTPTLCTLIAMSLPLVG